MREFNTGSFPRLLSFMLGSMSKWVYDESPTEGLKFEKPLAALKEQISNSGSKVFQGMVESLLLKNTHRTTIEMVPSKSMEAELIEDEQKRLAAIKSNMSEEDLEQIIAKTAELKNLQATDDPPEARATIPSLQLSDLKREATDYPISVTENEANSGVTVVRHELGSTSGIAYTALGLDVSMLSFEDVPLLPLLTRIMMETGAGEYDSVALSQRIGMYTGGISVELFDTPVKRSDLEGNVITDCETMVTKLVIKGKATSENIDELFSLFKLILTDAKLDSQAKVVEMLKEKKSRMESSIQGSGHSYALGRMRARYTAAGYIDEKLGGISHLTYVKTLLEQAENDWPSLLSKLENIRSMILGHPAVRDGAFLDITGDSAVMQNIQPAINQLLETLPGYNNSDKLPNFYNQEHPWVTAAKLEMSDRAPLIDEGFVVPTQVSYVGKGGRIYDSGETLSGSATVVARFLRTGYLWDHVRVIGGAYGGMCTFAQGSGFFGFLSYRDPNLSKTLDVYDAAADALMAAADELEKDSQALATAIIGTIGDMDGALSPDQKGWTAFSNWITGQSMEDRQRFRDEVLNTKASDFRDFAHRLRNMKNPSVAVVSSKAAFEAASKEGKVLTLTEVL
jgi:presequence protease